MIADARGVLLDSIVVDVGDRKFSGVLRRLKSLSKTRDRTLLLKRQPFRIPRFSASLLPQAREWPSWFPKRVPLALDQKGRTEGLIVRPGFLVEHRLDRLVSTARLYSCYQLRCVPIRAYTSMVSTLRAYLWTPWSYGCFETHTYLIALHDHV